MNDFDNSMEYSRYIAALLQDQTAPSVLFQQSIKISKDWNMWCVLWGDNIQEWIVWFWETITKALRNFDWQFDKKTDWTYPN